MTWVAAVFYGNPICLTLFSFFEGRASGVCAAGSAAGTNRNLLCSAVGFAIMVYAIFHVTANPLDMILRAHIRGATALFGFTIHFVYLLCKNTIIIIKTVGIHSCILFQSL